MYDDHLSEEARRRQRIEKTPTWAYFGIGAMGIVGVFLLISVLSNVQCEPVQRRAHPTREKLSAEQVGEKLGEAGAKFGRGFMNGVKETKELKRLEGVWDVVSASVDGHALPKDEVIKMKYKFNGDKLSVWNGEQKVSEGTVTLDMAKNPNGITVTDLADKTLSIHGVYDLDGHKLRIAYSPVGQDAPQSVKAGNQIVLKRGQ